MEDEGPFESVSYTTALVIKNTWVPAKGIVMLATRLLQTNPSTQADLKFKAYLDWEHLLKKMSFVFRIMACNSSSIIFHLIGFVLYRGNFKKKIWKFWPGTYRDQMANRY
jgi:hypothetical protein